MLEMDYKEISSIVYTKHDITERRNDAPPEMAPFIMPARR